MSSGERINFRTFELLSGGDSFEILIQVSPHSEILGLVGERILTISRANKRGKQEGPEAPKRAIV